MKKLAKSRNNNKIKKQLTLQDFGLVEAKNQQGKYKPRGAQVGFFEIDPVDFTSEYTIESMNKSPNYYEKLDFEFIAWNSTIRIVCPDKTLEELLKDIYDKYRIEILSSIFRKSIKQIQDKLKTLGLKNYINKYKNFQTKTIVHQLPAEIDLTKDKVEIIFHQTENREMETWYIQNTGYQNYDPTKVFIEPVNMKLFIQGYAEAGDYETLFKLLVVFCNLLHIPYKLLNNEEDSTDYTMRFIIEKNQLEKRIQLNASKKGKLMMKKLLQAGKK